MAKSNMKSAGIRKHHRRIQHQARIDNHNQQERIYRQKEHISTSILNITGLLSIIQSVSGFFSNLNLSDWLSRVMSGRDSNRISSLDLTKDSPFGPNRARDAGAWYLRSIWPALGTMVSTRDGKIIR